MDKTCKICGFKSGRGKNALSTHVMKEHTITERKYYDRFYKKKTDGKCALCNKNTRWSDRYKQYNIYCSRSCQMKDIANRPAQRALRSRTMKKTLKTRKNKK